MLHSEISCSSFRAFTEIASTTHQLIVGAPELVSHIPEALPLLLADGKIMEEKTEVIFYVFNLNTTRHKFLVNSLCCSLHIGDLLCVSF